MKNQVDEVLAKSIRKFLRAQYGQFQDRVVPDTGAMKFLESEPELVRQWVIIKLTRMVALEIRMEHRPKSDPYQPFLFGLGMYARLPLKGGRSIMTERATLSELRESLAVMKTAEHKKPLPPPNPKIESVQNLIEAMTPLGRGLNVGRYCELQAAGPPTPAARPTSERRR